MTLPRSKPTLTFSWLSKDRFPSIIIFAASCLVSCLAAFVNKFPIVYTDTGTYIHTGFDLTYAADRPMLYGLFLRVFSLGHSFWFAVFTQSVIACYLLKKLLQVFLRGGAVDIALLGSTTLLAIFTSFSFNVGILIPDVFVAFALLAVLVLLFNDGLRTYERLLVCLILVFSVSSHYAILLILLLVQAVMFCSKRTRPLRKKLGLITGLYLCTWLLVPLTHYLAAGKFRLSGAGHVFMVARLAHTGILKDYLAKFCGDNHYRICPHTHTIPWDFIWDPNSPVYQTGGWEANKAEYNMIIKDILTKPEYLGPFALISLESTLKTLFVFHTVVDRPLLGGTPPFEEITLRYPFSEKEYFASLQSSGVLLQTFSPLLEIPVGVLGMMGVMLLVIYGKRLTFLDPRLISCCRLLLLYSLANALVCSTLSGIDARFQNRLVWLFPFFVLVALASYLQHRYARKGPSDFVPGEFTERSL